MAKHHRDHDLAFELVDSAIEQLCNALDSVYVRPQDVDMYGQWKGESIEKWRTPPRLFFPTLPYAMGCFAPGEDIDIVCLGQNSEKAFWAFVGETLNIEDLPLVDPETFYIRLPISKIKRFTAGEIESIGDAHLRLSYRRRPRDFDPETSGSYLLLKSSIADDYRLAQIYDQQSFSIRYRHDAICFKDHEQTLCSGFYDLVQWAKAAAILAPGLKMMNAECLTHMWIEVYHSFVIQDQREWKGSKSWTSILSNNTFNRFFTPQQTLQLLASSGRDLAEDISPEGMLAIIKAFQAASNRVKDGGEFPFSSEDVRAGSLQSFELLALLETHCWVPKKRKECTASIPELLLALQERFRAKSDYRIRLWPSQDTVAEEEPSETASLLAVYHTGASEQSLDRTAVTDLLNGFKSKLSYDETAFIIELRLCTNEDDIKSLAAQNKNDSVEPRPGEPVANAQPAPSPPSISSSAGSKFRTTHSAMNRLRWDPAHVAIDYEVGYVDRFEKELLWKSLEKWESVSEEEEFVPEHRIRQIRRQKDGVVVWDREKRRDLTGMT